MARKEFQNKNQIKLLFQCFDQNHDGYISKVELEKAFKYLKISVNQGEIKEMMNTMSTNARINYRQFEEFVLKSDIIDCEPSSPEAIFRMFDINEDGKISKNEMKLAMSFIGQKPSDKEIDKIYRNFNCKDDQFTFTGRYF